MALTAALLALTLGCDQALTEPAGTDGIAEAAPLDNVVTNLEPAAYETDTLKTGKATYVDRSYTIQSVPSGYSGWNYLRTANDDKDATDDAAVAFSLADTARIALAYDVRATTLPDWLRDWTATGDTLRTSDIDYAVYTRVFGPGDVTLGGNLSGGAQGAESMYLLSATRTGDAPDGGESDGGTGSGGSSSSAQPIWTDDFESGGFNFAESNDDTGWDDSRAWADFGDIEVNSENPRTGSYSMMIRFPDAGSLDSNGEWPSGTSAQNRKAHWQVDHYKEIWVEYYMYVPDNYKHANQATRSNNRKFFVIWDEDRRDEHVAFYYEAERSTDLSSNLRLYQNMRYRDDEMKPWWSDGSGLGCGNEVTTCPGDIIESSDRGSWIQLRYHFKLSSALGVNDGAFHMWKDGELQMGASGVDAWPNTDDSCSDGNPCNFYLHHGQLLGAQNSPYDAVTKFFFDDFKIYTEDPGW